jgi:hypothetical protein
MQKLPEGWDHQHFNEDYLYDLVERYYFRLLRQKGHAADEPEVQARLKKVWEDYAYLKDLMFQEHTLIHWPGRLLARLLWRAYDEFEVRHDNTAPDLFKGVFSGQSLESL